MRILLLGSGGREHALALGLISSSIVEQLFVSPGNGGIASLGDRCRLVALDPVDTKAVVEFVESEKIDLTVIGPEAPLAVGVVDHLTEAGHTVFGPTQAAARLETSKAESKAFMNRWRLPTAESRIFDNYEAASAFLDEAPWPVVIKAPGLAAGKGVILPNTAAQAEAALKDMMLNESFGRAGQTVVIEERMNGPEVSLLCFSDGKNIAVMPTARDHKRLLDDDLGPNTGGMGAFSPVPEISTEDVEIWTRDILKPAIAGMQAEGTPYVGVLYAGLMLTQKGPRLLEFNCRFGDPEAQVLLPLLDCDLAQLLKDCATGQLDPETVRWKAATAATIVLASGGYPVQYQKGFSISGIDAVNARENLQVYQAGTKLEDEQIVTSGGRVLCVTALGETLESALDLAYDGIASVHFDGAHYRKDIGRTGKRS